MMKFVVSPPSGSDSPQQSRPGVLTRHTAAAHLHVLGDEDLACLLDHRLRLQLLGRELAFPGVEHFLAGHAGQSQVCRVRLVGQRHLDGFWVDGAGGVPGWGQCCCWGTNERYDTLAPSGTHTHPGELLGSESAGNQTLTTSNLDSNGTIKRSRWPSDLG